MGFSCTETVTASSPRDSHTCLRARPRALNPPEADQPKAETAYRGSPTAPSGMRFYSASLARWISRDPIEEEEIVLYVFVRNEPVRRHDARGLQTNVSGGGVGEGVITWTSKPLGGETHVWNCEEWTWAGFSGKGDATSYQVHFERYTLSGGASKQVPVALRKDFAKDLVHALGMDAFPDATWDVTIGFIEHLTSSVSEESDSTCTSGRRKVRFHKIRLQITSQIKHPCNTELTESIFPPPEKKKLTKNQGQAPTGTPQLVVTDLILKRIYPDGTVEEEPILPPTKTLETEQRKESLECAE